MPCEDGTVCEGGRCVEMFSVAAGGSCNTSRTCATGLVCGTDGKCAAPADVVYKNCASDADCGEGTTGRCVRPDVGNAYCETVKTSTLECGHKYEKLVRCLVKNECHLYVSTDLDSCGQQHCPDQVTAYFGCVDNCLKYQVRFGKDCISKEMHRDCPNIAPSVLSVIEFSALAIIFVVIVLIYLVVKGIKRAASTSVN
jgi:hypothetical protein